MSFMDILNKPAEAVEKPKPLPAGQYVCTIVGVPEHATVNDKPIIKIKLKPLSPQGDVDMGELSAQGGIGERMLNHTLWVEEDNLHRIKEFCIKFGISETGKTLGQMVSELPSRQAVVEVIHKPSKDGSELYANPGKFYSL